MELAIKPGPKSYRKKDKCLILASGPSMAEAPLKGADIDTYDLWVLNAAHRQIPEISRPSLWFQIHKRGSGHGHIDDPDHVEFLKSFAGCPILMQEVHGEFPASEVYPIEDLDYLQPPRGRYFTNTVDFMIALAIHEGYPDIYLFGVDMISDEDREFDVNRPSVSWYLGIAHGRGIDIHLPDSSALLIADHVYAYEDPPVENKRFVSLLQKEIERYEKMREDEIRTVRAHQSNADALSGMIRQAQHDIQTLKYRDRGSQF